MSSHPDKRDQTIQQLLRPLRAHLEQVNVTELTINRPGEVWTKTWEGWTRHEVRELNASYLHSLATALIVYNHIEPKSVVSVILPDGQRGQIVQPPACIEGSLSLNIRKHAPMVKGLEELALEGAFGHVCDVSFNKPNLRDAKAYLKHPDFRRLEAFEVDLLELKRENRIVEFLNQPSLQNAIW